MDSPADCHVAINYVSSEIFEVIQNVRVALKLVDFQAKLASCLKDFECLIEIELAEGDSCIDAQVTERH
jgi:hypothetical protein